MGLILGGGFEIDRLRHQHPANAAFAGGDVLVLEKPQGVRGWWLLTDVFGSLERQQGRSAGLW
ncbi:MAG: hypothetical protein RLZZ226_414 [Pseudomonadota bacterium]